jgi:hypothetical protein
MECLGQTDPKAQLPMTTISNLLTGVNHRLNGPDLLAFIISRQASTKNWRVDVQKRVDCS